MYINIYTYKYIYIHIYIYGGVSRPALARAGRGPRHLHDRYLRVLNLTL